MASLYGSYNIWGISFHDVVTIISTLTFDNLPTVSLVVVILNSIFMPTIMTGNGIVVAAIWKDPYKQLRLSPSNIIISSMACADFLVGLSNSINIVAYLLYYTGRPIWIYILQWYVPLITSLIGLSVMHVFSLTIDRLIAIVKPMRYRSVVTRQRVRFYVIFIWCFHLLLSLSQIPLQHHYFIYSFVIFILLNLMITATAVMSLVILHRIWKPNKELRKMEEIPGRLELVRQRNKKATKSILLIVGVFKTCFAPFSICWLIILTCVDCQDQIKDILRAYTFSIWIMILNSCINPFLYAFRLPKLKKPISYVANTLFCQFCKSRRISFEASITRSSDGINNLHPAIVRENVVTEENHPQREETKTAL